MERRKGVCDGTTGKTDTRLLKEAYIEIYRHHPYLTMHMVSQMQYLGWTHSEIKEGILDDGVFIPKVKSSYSKDIELQGFPLFCFGHVQWKRAMIYFLGKNRPELLSKNETK